jgi:hypothetical protein
LKLYQFTLSVRGSGPLSKGIGIDQRYTEVEYHKAKKNYVLKSTLQKHLAHENVGKIAVTRSLSMDGTFFLTAFAFEDKFQETINALRRKADDMIRARISLWAEIERLWQHKPPEFRDLTLRGVRPPGTELKV